MPTFTEEYSTVDKSEWGEGLWTSEPDKAVWIDEETGLDCLIVRNRMGALCGYVGVPKGHPAHGAEYDNVRLTDDEYPDVHGGLTFSGACQPVTDHSTGICHIPQEGRPDNVWWLGFDCAHSMDIVPSMVASNRKRYEEAKAIGDAEGMRLWSSLTDWDEQYRTVEYVVCEVERLARQLATATVTAGQDVETSE